MTTRIIALTAALLLLAGVASARPAVLTWVDNSPAGAAGDEETFSIERADGLCGTPAQTFAIVGSVLTGVTTFTDPTPVVNTNYCYRVRALNGAGPSVYSNLASFFQVPPVAPTNLQAK